MCALTNIVLTKLHLQSTMITHLKSHQGKIINNLCQCKDAKGALVGMDMQYTVLNTLAKCACLPEEQFLKTNYCMYLLREHLMHLIFFLKHYMIAEVNKVG